MTRQIPNGAVKLQTGLWLHTSIFYINGVGYTRRKLYSSVGYCFYDKNDKVFDEEGNEIAENEILPTQRTYMQYAQLGLSANVDNYVSIVKEDSYEIV